MVRKKKPGVRPRTPRVRFDKAHICAVLGCSEDDFHRNVKADIVRDFINKIAAKGLANPDIGVDDAGNVVFRDPRDGRCVFTDVPLDSYSEAP